MQLRRPDTGFSLYQGEEVEDLQCNDLKLIVKRDGFRYGTDSVLLAYYVKAGAGSKIVELCSGSGVVSVLLAEKTKASTITGIEIQKPLAEMANRSAALNGIDHKVRFIHGDVRRVREILSSGAAGTVVANPPYLKCSSGKVGSDISMEIARREICCDLSDITGAAGWLLHPGGSFYIVYRPDRLVDLFYEMRVSGIEPKEIRQHGPPGGPPSLVLVCGKKNAVPGLRWLKPL